jgi:Fic family protein
MTTIRSAGRTVPLEGGAAAFVPEPLPPAIDWSDELVAALSTADRAIARLAGEAGRLPNPHLLIRPFIRREAVLSSRIEGTRTGLEELLAAEAGAGPTGGASDLAEVANYVAALEYGVERLQTLPLSLRLVRELHARLMRDVPGGAAAPGEFRRVQNWIGPPGAPLRDALFVPPPPGELPDLLGQWERFLHDRTLPPLVQAALLHYQFEALHPFLDGNGRLGRLLIVLFFIERAVLPTPLLYLSAFFEATRDEYMERLRGVSERGAWKDWLRYFLSGVAGQAEDALNRARQITTLLESWRVVAAERGPRTASDVVALLGENPFWTIRRIQDRLGVAYTTAQRAVQVLEHARVLDRVGDRKRDRLYCATELLRILLVDPVPTPADR